MARLITIVKIMSSWSYRFYAANWKAKIMERKEQ